MSIDINKFQATLGAISSDVQESVNNVRNAEKANEPKRLIINGVVAVLVVLALIVGYNRLFVANSTVTTETTNVAPENEVIQEINKMGQRLNYKLDLIEHKFTVLHIADNGNALVVDEEGDVWNMLAGKPFHPDYAEPTELQCDSYAITLGLTMPETVLKNCQKKVYSNSQQFKRDIPTCADGKNLWVTQDNKSVVYSCK